MDYAVDLDCIKRTARRAIIDGEHAP